MESVHSAMSSKDVMSAREIHSTGHALYMTIAVPSRMRGKSCTVAISPSKRRMKTATETGMKVVMNEDVLILMKGIELSHLSSEVASAHEALLLATMTVFCVCN